ncbi:flavin monoamine oxidase family protein [Massilia antarctica]|uniref:flavin monoamine oxidase family protein n=1 Tax=Massilia antarctica TaxID=2765360 RepID=UPI0035E49E03
MTNYVIAGAGASGLYAAYRLLNSGSLKPGDTVKLFEWSMRPGGRIFSYAFPQSAFPPDTQLNGLYCEFGGMRFAVDSHFPDATQISEGHVLVQQMIIAMGLQNKVVPFLMSSDRMYYLRGKNIYETAILEPRLLPYNFNEEFLHFLASGQVAQPYTADNILGGIASVFAPGLGSANVYRARWCDYYANGTVSNANATLSFPSGTAIRDIGYWNMLYDQFGDEGFDYSADGTGYTSNVINWNAADAMQANNDYGSGISYMRLDGGYSTLFESIAGVVEALAAQFPGSGIFYGQQLTGLVESETDPSTACTFVDHTGAAQASYTEQADVLFLAMPRRALEMVGAGSAPTSTLNNPQVRYFMESSIDQPAIKLVLVFDQAWWTSSDCTYPPNLVLPAGAPAGTLVSQGVGGDTITDLPLRMIYYFGNNVPGGPGLAGGPYVLLASYDDMNYASFWRELEQSGDYMVAPSLVRQPLTGPTSVPPTSSLAKILLKQLAEVHGIALADVPQPLALYFQDWGQDPFGGGYHGWAAHYDICNAMDSIRAPCQRILSGSGRKTYIIGSCYSFDQAWVEGAFCTAESVLQEFIGLPPLNAYIGPYTLVCSAVAGRR